MAVRIKNSRSKYISRADMVHNPVQEKSTQSKSKIIDREFTIDAKFNVQFKKK